MLPARPPRDFLPYRITKTPADVNKKQAEFFCKGSRRMVYFNKTRERRRMGAWS